MKPIFKSIIIITLFTQLILANESIKQLSNTIATPFYNVYNQNVMEILNHYVQRNQNIEAIKVYDTMLDKTSIIFYKKDGQNVFKIDEDFQKKFKFPKYKYTEDIVKNGKVIGQIILYSTRDFSSLQKPSLQLTSDEEKWLDKHKTIKIASLTSWPKNTKGQNIHTEYLNLLRKYGNINIYDVEFESWKEAYENTIDNNFVHAILYLSWSKERSQKYFNYLPPYSFVPVNLVVKQNNDNIKSLKDLQNSSIYTLQNSISNTIIKESKLNIQTISLKSEEDLVKALASRKPEAKAILTFNYTPKRFENNNLKIIKRIQNKYGDVHIGVSKKHSNVYSILKKAHNNIPQNELAKIQNFQFTQNSNQFVKQLNTNERIYLSKKTNIKMCVDPDWEPYEIINKNNEHQGLAADFIQLIEQKIEKKIHLVKTKTWTESLEYIKSGKCEILSFLNKTPDRTKYLNFTPTLYEEAEVIVAKENVTYIDGLEHLNNKTIGIVKGYKIDEYIKNNFPDIRIQYIKNYEEGLKLVSQGKIYATINSLLGTAHLMRKLNLINIKIAGTTSLKNKYKIAISKNDPLLHLILSKAVKSITTKEKNTILSNWVSIKFEQKIDYTLVFQILLAGTILFILFSYWTYKLKLENKKRVEAEEKLKKLNQELEQRIEIAVKENDKKEKILQQQTRLAQMGEMISMIAHQWRQPLGSINSATIAMNLKLDIFKSTVKQTEADKETLEFLSNKLNNISKYVLFLSTTIDDFRNFFKPDKQKEITSMTEIITISLGIVKGNLDAKNINVITNFHSKIPLELYKNEMIQVVLNIIKNAEDNFLDKNIKNPTISFESKTQGDTNIIEICDNGGGINQDIIDNIFDPYFSTKDEKNGTGMGLYMSKIIVEDHNNGKLIASNKESGACFSIYFNIK